MFVQCDEIETLVGEIFGQQEEHRGAAIEGASNEDVVGGKKQGEEEELGEGLPVLIPNPGENVNEEIRPMFIIIRHPNGFIQHWFI